MFNTTHTATVQVPTGSFQVTSNEGQSDAAMRAMFAAAAHVEGAQIAWTDIQPTFAKGHGVVKGEAVQINIA